MSDLSPDTILCRAPELRLHLDSNNELTVYTENGAVRCGSHGLAVLEAFTQPISLAEGLAKLGAQVSGIQDWKELTETIVGLHRAGVLRADKQPLEILASDFFSRPGIHVALLNDRERTSGYLSAISEVVRPGDVVVDLGTGTGILAMAAARAGARHVYAIEASGVGELARALFEANGMADRITLVRGWSARIELPEPADVLVSEIIGDDPLAEQVLEFTCDAIRRLACPGARLIPSRLQIYAVPVALPAQTLAKQAFVQETLDNWGAWYGFDFSPLGGAAPRAPYMVRLRDASPLDWQWLSEPLLLGDVDLRACQVPVLDRAATTPATAGGQITGVLVYFELQLSPSFWLSTHPARIGPGGSWHCPVWLLGAALPVRPGDCIEARLRYEGVSQLTCTVRPNSSDQLRETSRE